MWVLRDESGEFGYVTEGGELGLSSRGKTRDPKGDGVDVRVRDTYFFRSDVL